MKVWFLVANAARGVEAWRQTGCRLSVDSVAVMRAGRTACQARHGADAWRCSAEPSKTQACKFERHVEKGGSGVWLDEL